MTLNQLIYQVAKPLGGLQVAKFLSRHHPKILMYHRILDDSNVEGLTADIFRKQMKIIKKNFLPMTLKDLLSAHEQGRVPANAIVITFDDGYADFAEVAFPILEAEAVPVTLFVTTGFVNGDIWLWPDQIRYAISKARTEGLTLQGINQPLNLQTQPLLAWDMISDYCLTISNSEKLATIDELFYKVGVQKPEVVPNEFRPVSWEQIRQMIERGLDVGSHSISHPILTKLDENQLAQELKQSREKLQQEIGRPVDVFCYPNGEDTDFDQRVQEWIKHSGYRYAVSAFPSRHPISDNWCINRYPVGSKLDMFEKNVFGLSYLAMTS